MFRKGGWQVQVRTLPLIISIFVSSCAPHESPVQEPLSEWRDVVGCPQMHRQKFFNPYYIWAQKDVPTPEEELLNFLENHPQHISESQRNKLLHLHRTLMEKLYSFATAQERLEYLAQLDLGEFSSEAGWFNSQWMNLYGAMEDGDHCVAPQPLSPEISEPSDTPGPSLPHQPSEVNKSSYVISGQPRAWIGAMKAFATAYQSCGSLYRPALTEADPSLQGLAYYGMHFTGASSLYTVRYLDRLVSSHPYLRDWIPADAVQCANVISNPLIYDYGGKPYVDPNSSNELNFFKNAGTGSPALGVDCSGFVFSALASVGLKLRSDMPLKANHVYGVSAAMLMSPERNGFDCLKPIEFRQLRVLNPGDIVASSNHVFMVDRVGDDPLGVGHLREDQCTAAHMDFRRFDFDIVQSSAAKNFLGIQRSKAVDYLEKDITMRRGLEDYALSLCKARFGIRRAPTRSLVSVVRASESPTCRANPVTLTYQSCVKGCFDLPDVFKKYY